MGHYGFMNMQGKIYHKKCECKHNNCKLQILNSDVKTHKAKIVCTCGKFIKWANEEDIELLILG